MVHGSNLNRAAVTSNVSTSSMPLFRAAFLESNPGPIKFLLSEMGLVRNELRLPLVPVEPATEKAVIEAAKAVGLTLAASSLAGTRARA